MREYRESFPLAFPVGLTIGRVCPGIAICADSTLGSDLLSFHPHLDLSLLTKLLSLSSAIHYYKSSGTIGVSSASSLSYRQLIYARLISCRPHVKFHCDVNFDPFTYLRENNKTYGPSFSCLSHQTFSLTSLNSGFALSMVDYRPTLPSLWSAVKGTSDALLS